MSQGSGAEGKEEKKVDISKLVSIIPPASELMKKEKKLSEKRVRVRIDQSLKDPVARIPSALTSMLGIREGDVVEVVVAGRRKFTFKATVFESQDENVVHVAPRDLNNIEVLRSGVADNSIATVRRSSS